MYMVQKHVQAELPPNEYAALRRAARRQGRTVKDAVREAIRGYVRSAGDRDDPFFGIIGLVHGPRTRRPLSAQVDEIVYDEEDKR